jgi:hypothetical protein
MTIVVMLKQQHRNVLDYLTEAYDAANWGRQSPSLALLWSLGRVLEPLYPERLRQVSRPNGAGYGTANVGNSGANTRIWFDGCCGWLRHRRSVGLDAAKTQLCTALIPAR